MSRFSLGRIEAIIAQLQSADDAAREKYLEHLRSEEPELLAEVLRFMRNSGTFLEGMGEEIWEALTPGTKLIGRTIKQYTIEEVIGVGGMGVVYKAWDSRLKVHVALKFLPERLRGDENARERFMVEAHTVAQLDHPNVCAIYAVDETENGVPFLSMRLYEGETLRERLSTGSLSAKDAKSILRQTALGLAAAHAKGLIHRDIKPENIFLTNSGSVKILDFGIAAATDDSRISEEDGMVGTVAYMSPEQTRGDPATVQSDLWALGAVGYEMLTNQSPFEAADRQATIQRILNEDPDALPSSTPKPLARAINTCLRKNPSKRYSRARDVRKVLDVGGENKWRRAVLLIFFVILALSLGWLLRDVIEDPAGDSQDPTRFIEPVDGPSILIAPFDLAPESQKHYPVASGMYEDLVISLGSLGGIAVRRAPSHIQNPEQFTPESGADFLLTGRIFEDSVASRLEFKLFSNERNRDQWSYEAEFRPSNLQNVLRQVTDRLALAVNLESDERQSGGTDSTSTEAYVEYLIGLNSLKERTPRELYDSQAAFLRAIEIDSMFSQACARLSLAMALSVGTAYSADPDPSRFEEARRVAKRAIELDSTNAAAHSALAYVLHERDWEWEAAGKEFERALELNRDDATTFHLYASHLAELDNLDDALDLQLHAIELEPDVPIYHANYAQLLYLDRRSEEALQYLDDHSDVLGDFFLAAVWRSLSLLELGRVDEALLTITEAAGPQHAMNPLILAIKGKVLAKISRNEALDAASKIDGSRLPVLVALIYGELGEYDLAIEYLQQGFEQHDVYMTLLKVWPGADSIRDRPEFRQILRDMNLED